MEQFSIQEISGNYQTTKLNPGNFFEIIGILHL